MKVFINGQVREVREEETIVSLLEQLGIKQQHIAIELNKKVLKRKDWEEKKLLEGDTIEIVHFVGGG
jgi:thiamine biosynthesis protein ThiS